MVEWLVEKMDESLRSGTATEAGVAKGKGQGKGSKGAEEEGKGGKGKAEEAKKKEKAKVARERVAREEAKKKKARVAREEAKKMKRRVAREKVAREEVGRKVGKERRRNEGWNEHGWWSWDAQGWDGWEGWSQHNASSIDEPWEKLVRYLLLSFHTWAGQPPLCFTFGLGKPPIVCHMWAG